LLPHRDHDEVVQAHVTVLVRAGDHELDVRLINCRLTVQPTRDLTESTSVCAGPSLLGVAKHSAPFLMFQNGDAEPAMTLYTSLFDDGLIRDVSRYGPDGPGPVGTVQVARFCLAGQDFLCSDSFVTHAFTFTPSLSIWIETESEDELDRLAAALGDGGASLMPLGNYGFSRRFAWINDRYGVSWQLNFA
jgi:predicted 3-demethylubiquinone-9 3-methyltransferase (glyoxalase superfamily)